MKEHPINRSAEHRLGKFLNSSKRAETVLGAPIARFMTPLRVQRWRSKLPMNLPWERRRLAGELLDGIEKRAGETPALPGSWPQLTSKFWRCSLPLQAIGCGCLLLAGTALLGQTNSATNISKPLENTLGMKLVKVPGAPVMFSVWETRVRDYQVFVDETRREWTRPDFAQTPDDPVVNVSWDDAAAFCQWLTARERKAGRLTDKQRYRFPTDPEWSLAVGLGIERGRTPEDRLQTAVVWPWGFAWPPPPGAGNYAPELETDKFTNTAPVGSFKPNQNGLFDLGGNVWEWCDDWYNDARVTKALRGGSFHDRQPKDLLAAYRFSATVHLSNDDIGFRVVLENAVPPNP